MRRRTKRTITSANAHIIVYMTAHIEYNNTQLDTRSVFLISEMSLYPELIVCVWCQSGQKMCVIISKVLLYPMSLYPNCTVPSNPTIDKLPDDVMPPPLNMTTGNSSMTCACSAVARADSHNSVLTTFPGQCIFHILSDKSNEQ